MKKLNTIILIFFIVLSFAACTNGNQQETTTVAENKQSASVDETIYADIDSKNESDNLKETEASYSGGGELTLQKYRSIYYSIPSPFWDIVDENSRQDIYGEYWEQPYSQINTMRMKIFVEEYNVPREKFDAANAEWARIVKERLYGTPVINPQDFVNQEFNEVYNADIIYTFDDEIINEYYLSHDYPYCYESEYEKAVEDGIYNTQTTKIIDLANLKNELLLFNQLKEQKNRSLNNSVSSESVENSEVIEPAVADSTQATIPEETEITE